MAGPADTLRRVPLFEDLEQDELQTLADAMRERTFAAGETIATEGAAPDSFYVVEAGEAAVTVGGEERGTIGPGDYFGEIALMMGSERTATITARTELRCQGLTALDFRDIVESNPTIAWKLAESMMDRLS
jgi:CRP-like cAMP-binding protein